MVGMINHRLAFGLHNKLVHLVCIICQPLVAMTFIRVNLHSGITVITGFIFDISSQALRLGSVHYIRY